jgi:hypothetical protein
MYTYSVIRKADQAQVYRYANTEPVEWPGMEFATHDHVAQAEPVEAPPPPLPPVRITKLAFRNRFTQAEKVAIEIAALDNPAASMQVRAQSAALRSSQLDVQAAQFIDLTRADTRAGVQMLETAGLLAAGRAAVILDTPPTETEVWNG